jgi:hypothetical protein
MLEANQLCNGVSSVAPYRADQNNTDQLMKAIGLTGT